MKDYPTHFFNQNMIRPESYKVPDTVCCEILDANEDCALLSNVYPQHQSYQNSFIWSIKCVINCFAWKLGACLENISSSRITAK